MTSPDVVPNAMSAADLSLRAMRVGDLDQAIVLERVLFGAGAWSKGAFREEIEGFGRTYVVAVARRADGTEELVGYAGLWFNGDFAEVTNIAVAPRWQRQGVGALLFESLLRRAEALEAESVLLEVRVDNAPAIALYERYGFEPIGIRKRYYQPEDVDALTMRLVMPAPLSGFESLNHPG